MVLTGPGQQPKRRMMGVRLVTSDGSGGGSGTQTPERKHSDASLTLSLGQQSPEVTRRAMTATAMRNGGRDLEYQGLRARAASGD